MNDVTQNKLAEADHGPERATWIAPTAQIIQTEEARAGFFPGGEFSDPSS
ncbi:hypothetical protein [Brevundimonas sp.]|nr:hypothetical protein [Brevundimonas sp.]MDZ4365401.1 hypothetical protein [Brevundimonas sp.]